MTFRPKTNPLVVPASAGSATNQRPQDPAVWGRNHFRPLPSQKENFGKEKVKFCTSHQPLTSTAAANGKEKVKFYELALDNSDYSSRTLQPPLWLLQRRSGDRRRIQSVVLWSVVSWSRSQTFLENLNLCRVWSFCPSVVSGSRSFPLPAPRCPHLKSR
jgi:hypothetical protein